MRFMQVRSLSNLDYIVSDVNTIENKILSMKDGNLVADDSTQEFG